MIPVLGYAAPVLAVQAPFRTLSHAFWTPQQTAQFNQIQTQNYLNSFNQLVEHIQKVSPKIKTIEDLLQNTSQLFDQNSGVLSARNLDKKLQFHIATALGQPLPRLLDLKLWITPLIHRMVSIQMFYDK